MKDKEIINNLIYDLERCREFLIKLYTVGNKLYKENFAAGGTTMELINSIDRDLGRVKKWNS